MRRVFSISLASLALALTSGCGAPSSRPVDGAGTTSPAPAALSEAEAVKEPSAKIPLVRTPEALDALIAEYERAAAGGNAASLAPLSDAIDEMAAQRDARTSHLFWYTDLEQAKAQSRATGKPILSLRLLGSLRDELSCANSRLFRIVLYANTHVSQFLRDNYVLHWSSERPATTMTLDYGDGRVIKRTITGNSVHYVLDSRGRVVDALPGLYGPAAFEKGLRESLEVAKKTSGMDDEHATKELDAFHTRRQWTSLANWRNVLHDTYPTFDDDALKTMTLPEGIAISWPDPTTASTPATIVNELTVSKAGIEDEVAGIIHPEILVSSTFDAWWPLVSSSVPEHLDDSSKALIQAKNPRNWGKSDAPLSTGEELAKKETSLERQLVIEDLRNEYMMHARVHVKLAKAKSFDFETINTWIYKSIFWTPENDAWLGLVPTEPITAIADDGLVSNAPAESADVKTASK